MSTIIIQLSNSSFSPTCCAERTAIFKAISEGSFRDKNSFVSIAVVGGKTGEETKLCTPCGVCRQVLAEFCSADFLIITEDGENIRRDRLSELLPKAFVFERDSEI